jgi:hypothetical protein
MNIPKDKLPLHLGNKMVYGQWGIMCKHPKPTEFQTGKFAGQIAYKDLSIYVVKASNNLPLAVELLEKILKVIETSEHWWMDCPNKGGFDIEEIKEFLSRLEND